MTLGSGVGTSGRHFQRTVGSGVGTRLLRTAAVLILVATTAAQAQRSAPPPSAARAADSPVPPLLAAAVREGDALPRLHSLLVSQRGTVLVERYFHGTRATRLANVKSVAKSVISALVGVAVARGVIPSVREPIGTYFGDLLRAPSDAPKRAITVEDLLTMRSGLETTSNRNYGAWVRSPNWVRFALAQPLLTPPGTAMDYSTGSTHLLSAILTRATRKTTLQFAQEVIGTPLGFSVAPWTRDPQGIYFGGNDMAMTPRQMLAFGDLYLHEGRVGATQVLPAQWIRDSWVPRGRSLRGDRDDREYGYGWWIRTLAGQRTYYAWGFGGQFIFVVPALELVVVTTSSTVTDDERRAHRRTVNELVESLVIAPLAEAQSNSSR